MEQKPDFSSTGPSLSSRFQMIGKAGAKEVRNQTRQGILGASLSPGENRSNKTKEDEMKKTWIIALSAIVLLGLSLV
ncbi:MAG: hypothetical protein R6X21_02345, partial [Candidatus Aminicenantes bacterium]